ncbi:hypothetical protein A8B81_16600 [Sulfitobacter pontiacus]|uniref:hypothetical protein n=1 Tax=Sulfitobacter pontiacus TaxID=60137 RepID=UPI0007D96706|nr:hypothetical protein [Sulfitobacter pontiacus]OAN75464.1 hypothetical protein A8B81_16600 [Sulfitobacter pontiacus]
MISDHISEVYPEYGIKKTDAQAKRVLEDLYILARCAISKCRVTYTDAITLRGYGNRQNGKWLDDVYSFAISPLGFPDLTMLVVNAATGQPSEDAFEARRSKLSEIQVSEVPREQNRCIWFNDYEAVLGPLESIPTEYHYARSMMAEPIHEAEIRRAVSNAIQRVNGFGKVSIKIGKEYVGSGNYSELCLLTSQLLKNQKSRCALTGQPFEKRSATDGGVQDDRMSLDRIDNSHGYYDGNVQLVTQFANRARGQLSIEEARRRLTQYEEP